jgi:hypothetical protein
MRVEDGRIDPAGQAEVQLSAERIAEEHGYQPGGGQTLYTAARVSVITGFAILVVFGALLVLGFLWRRVRRA